MKPIVALAVFLTACTTVAAGSGVMGEGRQSLRRWGFAYCLNKASTDPAVIHEAQRAMAGYFEQGRHSDEAAYAHVRTYVDGALARAARASKHGGAPLVIAPCLDMIEAPAYDALIKAQDGYLDR